MLIKKTVDKIETDIYYKPTDSKQYLLFNSCHPKHVAANIPYNLARRICTIVDNTETRNIRLEELKTFLENQNYPKTLIEAGIKKAKEENKKHYDSLDKNQRKNCYHLQLQTTQETQIYFPL